MKTKLSVSKLITPARAIQNGAVIWDDEGRLLFCGAAENSPPISNSCIELSGFGAAPGLIDIHVHGGYGIEFGHGDIRRNLEIYSEWVARFGVTGFLITLSGPDSRFICHAIKSYVPLLSGHFNGAQPLGFHLEGPFLNPKKHGAFNPDWLRQPTIDEMQLYEIAAKGWVKQVSIAPELDGADALADYLKERGICVALAHSTADYKTASRALNGSFSHITHTFNTQSLFHHRNPGVVGAVLTSKSATAELIADGFHVHPAVMRILLKCIGAKRVVLITDAMPGAGLPDGSYDLVGRLVNVKDGKAFLPDGTIAGSTATLDACVRNMIDLVEVSLKDAIQMASMNPARVVGMGDHIGNLSPGKNADIIIFDNDFKINKTFIKGNEFLF
jgi:N-acetylglucosamine-6-phosphate deacetylase